MAGSYDSDDDKRPAKKGGAQKKFTQKTKEYKRLEKLFKDGRISPSDKPSDIRMSDPGFLQFTTTQFRSQYNQLKKVHGTCTKEGKLFSAVRFCICPTVK